MTEEPPVCHRAGCGREAAFWFYAPVLDSGREEWRPVCEPHARHLHPSLEVHAWLESGYLRPVERDRPTGRPPAPAGGRALAFREVVDGLLEEPE